MALTHPESFYGTLVQALKASSDNGKITNIGISLKTECQSESHLENTIHVKYLPQREGMKGTDHTHERKAEKPTGNHEAGQTRANCWKPPSTLH